MFLERAAFPGVVGWEKFGKKTSFFLSLLLFFSSSFFVHIISRMRLSGPGFLVLVSRSSDEGNSLYIIYFCVCVCVSVSVSVSVSGFVCIVEREGERETDSDGCRYNITLTLHVLSSCIMHHVLVLVESLARMSLLERQRSTSISDKLQCRPE